MVGSNRGYLTLCPIPLRPVGSIHHRLDLRHMRFKFWLSLLVLAAGLCLVLGWWGSRGLPHFLAGPPVATATGATTPHLLPCVSYSPFRHPDINPFNPVSRVTPAQIEADLRVLQAYTGCVRTYGLSQGLDAVPAIAAKLGMRVRLGVWLARDVAQNQAEIDRGIALASQYPGVVDLLVVGNEVLLRRELTVDALGKVLDYARQNSPVPVTYADVWEFWLRNATLARHVDVVTVHILPYWEDHPVAVDESVAHVLAITAQVKQSFAGQPVWVGETGWPAAGRQRAGAVPGRVAQSRFFSELVRRAGQSGSGTGGLNYNVIEAFDQPWKRAFEGAMGGYWGLFDQFGQARVAFAGEVVEDASWWRGFLGAPAGGLLGALFFTRFGTRFVGPPASALLIGATLGAMLPVQWLMSQQWDRTLWEQCESLLLAVIGAAAALATLPCRFSKFESATRLALLFAAATAALVLLLDARYRPFPWWWFLAPAAALLAARLRGREAAGPNSFALLQQRPSEELLLAAVLACCAIGIALLEGWRNAQALSYCAVMLTLAGCCAGRLRTNTSNANSAAGADSSVV